MGKTLAPSKGHVVHLDQVRHRLRLAGYQTRLSEVLDANRRALTSLFRTHAVFTPEGTRVGRDLLLAHEHLLSVLTLLEQLSGEGSLPPPRTPAAINAVYARMDELLGRTAELTERTGTYLAQRS